ncbi:MAG TPA: carbamoyltransferase HypF [Anaerolineae bacterium]|nr:carbamoyltransferase HypF [Anaerolineae bacterium]
MSPTSIGKHIHISGIVQGVGFRPFVYGLALRHELHGEVRNTSSGVDISIEGAADQIDHFIRSLTIEAPPLAKIDSIEVQAAQANGFTVFSIVDSVSQVGAFQPISPDIGLCDDCRHELIDPTNRRYRYPFINCTNCGPRFTIIQDIPYDRPLTTMAPFVMCPDCAKEYVDPLDRRFHAQPIACPKCGPNVWLQMNADEQPDANEAIQKVQHLLADGKIVAIKGLGGFHLACDATHDAAVAELRRRKGRIDKPFALMAANLESIEQFCEVNDQERALLQSPQRPIVLLNKCSDSKISQHVAPSQSTLGVMLPYTPLHELLFYPSTLSPHPLVMTSGNFSEEPIAIANDDALARLALLADAFLLHNRDIHLRCDDSVVRVFENDELPIRRSRGFAPYPVKLLFKAPPILATGGELKNTFCVTRDGYAFLSQHIGDVENYETLKSLEDSVTHFEKLFRIQPQIIAYDLHPDYLASRYALQRAEREIIQSIGVQHHHAHIAACMVENNLADRQAVIGVAFDGTGYGTDGAIWGGEFLVADYHSYIRAAHLKYVPLPGGDTATRHPYRVALSYLRSAGVNWTDDLAPVQAADPIERTTIAKQIEMKINAPLTSSMGRLFDAVASMLNVRQEVNYEGQAAIELEALADRSETSAYPVSIDAQAEIDTAQIIRSVVADVRSGVPRSIVSARFHNSIALIVREVCKSIRDRYGVNEIALSGGVFQNVTLLKRTLDLLRAENFKIYTHRLVPPNDGGIALGQAVIAAASLEH